MSDPTHVPDDLEALGELDRRQAPLGRRAVDLEHDVMAASLLALHKARKFWLFIVAAGTALGSAGTFLFTLYGLKVGGAAELSTFRIEERRTDSVAEAALARHDSLIAVNRAAINATRGDVIALQQKDEMKMIVLCVIADKVDASTGGYCTPYIHHAR